ncbi:MAG: hypothetical protein ABH859_04985 [Pseudomonadota bacterium]
MSIQQVLRQVFAAGITADGSRVPTKAMGGGDRIVSRLEELQQQAQQASTPAQVQELLRQAAEYAMAAQYLEERWRNPREGDAADQQSYAAAVRALEQAETSLQAMLERYRTLAQRSAQGLEQMEQAIARLQSSGLLAQEPPTNLEQDSVFISAGGESDVIQAYHIDQLTSDMMLALASEGGQIVQAVDGSYVMTAVLPPDEIFARSAMMAVGARPEPAE